jgi:hypothetical protein
MKTRLRIDYLALDTNLIEFQRQEEFVRNLDFGIRSASGIAVSCYRNKSPKADLQNPIEASHAHLLKTLSHNPLL